MSVVSTSLLTLFLMTGFLEGSRIYSFFPVQLKQRNLLAFSVLSARPTTSPDPLPAIIESGGTIQNTIENQCRNVPTGVGIPGFQPGIHKNVVNRMFGEPREVLMGLWPNTSAFIYELIPNEVSLGFLFDNDSQLLRQTEASFTSSTEPEKILMTLNSMLGCQLNEEIKQGFEQVWQGYIYSFPFRLEQLEGVIEWEGSDRIYIGVWEDDLH